MTKICILQGAFLPVPPLLGGAVEKRWYLLAQKFTQRGHDVVHVSREWPGLPGQEIIAEVLHRRVSGFSASKYLFKLKILDLIYTLRALRQIPSDAQIIITNTFWAPILLRWFSRSKVYVDVARMPKGQMRLYRSVARLRANSSPVAAAIKRELPRRLSGLVRMIPNPLPYEAEGDVDFDSKAKTILFCGRIHPEKGLDLLSEAIHRIPGDWTIQVVGPWSVSAGGGGESYYDKIQKKLDSERVKFLGPVFDAARLSELYRNASIFVYPSVAEKGETFGTAPLEAMAFGCVPLVSDLSCFKDFITHGHNGMVFDHRSREPATALAESLMLLIENPERRLDIAMETVKVRTTHSTDRIADLFLADFQSILKCV